MTPEEIRVLVDRWHDALVRLDAAALAACYHENCTVESPMAGLLNGRVEVENTSRRFFQAFPDLQFERTGVLVSGNEAVESTVLTGTDTGGFLGQAPTGKPFNIFVV